MNEENIKTESEIKKYFIFIAVIFCFVGIPASILSYSVYRYFQTDEEKLVFYLKSENQKMTHELRKYIKAEQYFCQYFHEYCLSNLNNPFSSIKTGINFCKNIKFRYSEEIDLVAINNAGEVKYNSNPVHYKYTKKEWRDAYHYVRDDQSFYRIPINQYFGTGNISACKKIFGPQFVTQNINNIFNHNEAPYSLLWVDSSNRTPPCAVYPFTWGGIFIFISRELLNDFTHIKYITFDYAENKKITTGIFKFENLDNNFWSGKKISNLKEVKEALKKSKFKGNFIETNSYYIFHQYITKDIRAFSLIEKKNTNFNLLIKSLIAFLLYSLISLPIIKYCWNTIILKISGNASIRLKLAFLFLFATGIPLLTLAVIAHEYEMHKRVSLIEDARLWSVENLLGIEQRFLSYLQKNCNDLDNFIASFTLQLQQRGLDKSNALMFKNQAQKYEAINYYCIASQAPRIATTEGLLVYSGSLESLDLSKYGIGPERGRHREITVFNIIIKKLCSNLNGVDMPNSSLNKLEILAESIVQKNITEIIYTVVETLGFIKEWGFMSQTNMTYFKLISTTNNKNTDYIAMISWSPKTIQEKFINEILSKANRNPKNFKFIAYERYEKSISPSIYNGKKEIEKFARRATEKPTEEIETITLDGEEYIAVSFLGRNLYRYSFVGLYPMRNIDLLLQQQSITLWLLGIFCLFLSIGLAQMLSKSFIKPLNILQEGALAIDSRNFKHRLSGLNVDEFGEVGNIFNHIMVGLEELEVAKIVQESMFPKPEFNQGNFSIYGKSVTMIDVGGDYLDFFKVDDNSFSILLGDVAGHGVGAAVIMAMAKAAILGGGDSLRSPAAMLTSLHKMVLATKNHNQKKIMTFQYLHINSETGESLYGNAGACMPFLVRHSQDTVEGIDMFGPVLGGFKRAVFKEMKLDLQPGDAMVFYTDGIVECRNPQGEMIGYQRIKEFIKAAWSDNPETYYNNIMNAYYNYIGTGAEQSDDITIIVMVYNPPKPLEEIETISEQQQ